MLIVKHSILTTATPVAVWEVWQDVKNWNTWDKSVESSSLNGPFETGTTGTLKPKGGPLIHTKLTLVEPLKSFLNQAQLNGAVVTISHTLNAVEGKTEVTHEVEIKGPFASFYVNMIGEQMQQNLPQAMSALVKKAESISSTST